MDVVLWNGVYMLVEVETAAAAHKKRNETERMIRMGYWGKRFGYVVTADRATGIVCPCRYRIL